eukprot:6220786-Alexandrium_andersonii.AAC.1
MAARPVRTKDAPDYALPRNPHVLGNAPRLMRYRLPPSCREVSLSRKKKLGSIPQVVAGLAVSSTRRARRQSYNS